MLASTAENHADFAALSRYLIHGRHGETVRPERVDWITGHNVMTDDPQLAAKIMAATAKLSARVEKPVYHASIAWHHDEGPTREEMQTIAARTLALMGLGEHQALVVGHGDTHHPHLHMMINRVHPETGKAWSMSHDYLRLDRAMKVLAEDHGFAYVPAHRYNTGEAGIDALARGPTKPVYQKARREKRELPSRMTREKSQEVALQLKEYMHEARSWEDIETTVALQGYRLEPKGQGLVVEGGAEYATFSSVGGSMKALEKLFGESFSSYRKRPPQLVDGIDIVKALAGMGMADREDIAVAVKETMRVREERSGTNFFLRKEIANAFGGTLAATRRPRKRENGPDR